LGFSGLISPEMLGVAMRRLRFRAKSGLENPLRHARSSISDTLLAVRPLLLVLLLAQGLTAAEPEALPEPIRIAVSATGGVQYVPGGWSRLRGGVDVRYEEVEIRADHIEMRQSPVGAGTANLIDEVRVLPGPQGPVPDRVVFDSTRSQLPALGLRARLVPTKILGRRLPLADPLAPSATVAAGEITPMPASSATTVRWLIELHDLGDFSSAIRNQATWIDHTGWADRLDLILVADVGPDGQLGPQRLERIDMIGKRSAPLRRARLTRLKQAVPERLGAREADTFAESMWFSINLAADGSVQGLQTGTDTFGDLQGLAQPLLPGGPAHP